MTTVSVMLKWARHRGSAVAGQLFLRIWFRQALVLDELLTRLTSRQQVSASLNNRILGGKQQTETTIESMMEAPGCCAEGQSTQFIDITAAQHSYKKTGPGCPKYPKAALTTATGVQEEQFKRLDARRRPRYPFEQAEQNHFISSRMS